MGQKAKAIRGVFVGGRAAVYVDDLKEIFTDFCQEAEAQGFTPRTMEAYAVVGQLALDFISDLEQIVAIRRQQQNVPPPQPPKDIPNASVN